MPNFYGQLKLMPGDPSAPAAIFLSYARDDAESAKRIADALRAFGMEVWLDQSELRGGDSWDAKIKTQIRTCALFMPIISAQTQKRTEGYFRREWKFGVERTHDMAAGVAFVFPVVIDDTQEADATVPEEFMRFQWTRLPRGVPTPQFIEHVRQILDNPGKPASASRGAPPATPRAQTAGTAPPRARSFPPWAIGVIAALVVACVAALFMRRGPAPAATPVAVPQAPSEAKAEAPAPAADTKSVAVLPFANFSPDKDNEFFADGLQDEVITALAKIHDLKVISRTSVLAYKNPEGRNLKRIGVELGVATVLEGSVQRIGSKVHLNVQLIDARTDDHIWANSYTEELTDVFTIESSLAEQISAALKASFTTDEKALIERRPTENKEAYDLYLRGRVMEENLGSADSLQDNDNVISLFEQAAAKDPTFLLPHVQASILHGGLYWYASFDSSDSRRAKALAELEIAKRLAPSAPETHLAQGEYDYTCLNDWPLALEEFRAAEAGLPNDAQVRFGIGRCLRRMGQYADAIVEFEKAVSLNPNDENSAYTDVQMYSTLRRYADCVEKAKYYGERFPKDDFIKKYGAEAQFQLDGDRAALVRIGAVTNPYGDDNEHVLAYRREMLAGDLKAAERELMAPGMTGVTNDTGSINDPVSLLHAYLAVLLGKPEEAKALGAQAIVDFGKIVWTRRQLPWAHFGIARAEAYQGDMDAAARDAKKALDESQALDKYESTFMAFEYGKLLVITGRTEDAFSALAALIAGPGDVVPRAYAYDPVWARLKGDPRFQPIVDSVKPL
jgi:TolB-like protein